MARGQVKWFNAARGYGFIAQVTGGDIFVHRSQVIDADTVLRQGEWVEFEVTAGRKGPQAINVRRITAEEWEEAEVSKPYDFVPFAAPVRRDETVGHERFRTDGHHSGRLTYRLQALSPIFVASGSYALGEDIGFPDEDVVRACYRVGGVPAVPGSTLKGVVRGIVEAVTASCITVTRVEWKRLPGGDDLRRGCKPEEACPACSMFGRLNRMSKVSFGDALLTEARRTALYRLPALYAPRADWRRTAPVYLDSDGKFKGRKFYYHSNPQPDPRSAPVEVIPGRAILTGSLDFENLTEHELGTLFFALGLDVSFAPKLGGGKPVGLGSVQFLPSDLELLEESGFLRPERTVRYQGGELTAFIGGAIQRAQDDGYILAAQAEELRRILNPETRRDAPVGMY